MIIDIPRFGILQIWVLGENTIERIPSSICNDMHVTIHLTKGYQECNIHEKNDVQWVNRPGESLLVFPRQQLLLCLVEFHLECSIILTTVSNLLDGCNIGHTQTNLPSVAITNNVINTYWTNLRFMAVDKENVDGTARNLGKYFILVKVL